jgi:3-oxoacyl-[acyl-carrier-protein] synthase III
MTAKVIEFPCLTYTRPVTPPKLPERGDRAMLEKAYEMQRQIARTKEMEARVAKACADEAWDTAARIREQIDLGLHQGAQ